MAEKNSLLIIGKVWPEPDSSAAGTRMMQIIHIFLTKGFEITFASTSTPGDYSVKLEELGVKQELVHLNDSSFDDFMSKLNPDYVMFDRFMIEEQFGWRVAKHCPDAVRILDTVDLHCLRSARQKAWKLSETFHPDHLLSEDVAKREIASILRCDLSLLISEIEMDFLKRIMNLNSDLLHYLPFLFQPIDHNYTTTLPSFEERAHFVTIGNFRHQPNWNAVLWLKEEIWPLIRKKEPTAELRIYGSYPSQKVFQLNNERDGFLVKGRAKSALNVIQNSKVLLAPLRFGAGLKGKLVDAMLAGTPTVTTDIGAEGMAGQLEWNGGIENDAESFATAAVEIYNNPKVWTSFQSNGFEIVNQRFAESNFRNDFIEKVQAIELSLSKHREKNFIGSMLMHHTMASTKYMSLWIEQKNKNNS